MQRIGEFVPAQTPQPLPDDAIHLWFFPQWEKPPDTTDSPALRNLLAGYLDHRAASLRFERGEHGKPRLAGLQFNLSHTGNALLLGVSRHIELGVDLESATRPVRSVAELARRWFAPGEAQALAALPETVRSPAFLRLWTCKEAVLKASGAGISSGLERVEFELSSAGLVRGMRGGEPWRVLALAPDDAHIGAIAFRGKSVPVRAFVTQAIAAEAQSS